jgi:Fe-S-cluster containining protein
MIRDNQGTQPHSPTAAADPIRDSRIAARRGPRYEWTLSEAIRHPAAFPLEESTDVAGKFLDDDKTGNCLIYESRPFGCRTNFCAAAGGPHSRREVLDLIRRLESVDGSLGGSGPGVLQNAIADALSEL